jgi:demethylmenaquinone methyltransferase / 2-methoxy-6-polyprenyl-1,4-benzoquinol methylase
MEWRMSKTVHDMFASIAPRYDLANDVLSLGIHRGWRKKAVSMLDICPGHRLLDLCCGTGAFARALAEKAGPKGSVTGIDFVEEMLAIAREQSASNVEYVHGDAQRVNFPDESFDAVTIGFGVRNVDSPAQCLREIHRVLKPGRRAAVLEFGQITVPVLKQLYQFYSFAILPRIGGLLTGNRSAYEYLPETSAAFPAGEKFLAMMEVAGFKNVGATPLMFGLAYIYIGEK